MKSIIASIVLSGAGASFLMLFLTRLIPNDKLYLACVNIGKFLTGYGRSRMGRKFWEKLEDYIENSIGICWDGLRAGLNSDDGDDGQ